MTQKWPSIFIRDLTEPQRVGIDCELFHKSFVGGRIKQALTICDNIDF